ncbi:MAG: peptidylprolyl isomerase [Armatimonadota bacterium]
MTRWVLLCVLCLGTMLPVLAIPATIVPEASPALLFQPSGAIMVPLRPFAELFNAEISVNAAKVTVTLGGHAFTYMPGSTSAWQDGTPFTLPQAPFAAAGITYVPVREMATALGGSVTNIPGSGAVKVTFPKLVPVSFPLEEASTPVEFKKMTADLFLVSIANGRVRQLTFDAANTTVMNKRSPCFTPDGLSIIYARSLDIYKRRLDAPTGINLTSAFSKDGIASALHVPCPDGSLLFVQGKTDTANLVPDICRMGVDGSGFKQLAKGMQPIINADGKVIAYIAVDETTPMPQIHIMQADGGENRKITEGVPGAISPDGSLLYYVKLRATGNGISLDRLSGITLADGKEIGVTEAGNETDAPVVSGPDCAVSPDGKSLVNIRPNSGLWVCDKDLANARQLVDGNARFPRFSPDGAQIAYLESNRLFLMNADGSDITPIAPQLFALEYAFSPDGAHLLVAGLTEAARRAMLDPKPAVTPTHPAQPAPTAAEIAAAKKAGTRQAVIKTSKGSITVELYGKDAPLTTANFVKLAQAKFYDGLTFHRVEPGFVIQGGDPNGDGTGDPGYSIKLEITPVLKHVKGALAMARSQDPDSAGCQFYITLDATPMLDGNYAVFGKVIKGMDVVEKTAIGDKIISITVK